MQRLAFCLLFAVVSVAPGFVGDAVAQAIYNFSWNSEATGLDIEGNTVTRRLSGQTKAHVNVTATLVIIDFDTPLGKAHVEVQRDTLGFAENTFLPFDVPPAIGGEGRGLYGDFWVATYAGPLDAPSRTLNITLRQPGSGPAPELTFVGSGTLQAFTAWVTRPPNEATVSGTISVGMLADGGVGTDRTFRLFVDGTLASTQTITTDGPVSYALNTRTLSNGRHTLTLRVTDEAGAVAVDTNTIYVANSATTAPSVTFNLTQNQILRGSVPVHITTTGLATGTKRFYLLVDGVQAGYQVVTTNTITWYFRTLNWPNGTHTFVVRVVDATGRQVSRSVSVTIAN